MDKEGGELIFIITSVLILLMGITVITLFVLFQNRKNKLLQEQKDAQKRFEREIAETQIEIREETLRNISWELHDNIGQLLTLAKIQLQNATKENISEVSETISKGLNEVRALSKLINPEAIKNIQLKEAVQLEIDVDVRVGGSNPDLSTVIAPGTWLSGVPESLGGGAITVDDYWLVAQNSGVGIVEVDDRKFMLVNNYPNPFTGITNISFNAPHDMTGLEFNVYSILGSKVHTAKLDAERGVNNIEFNGSQLSSGLYIYTLSDGVNTLTRKPANTRLVAFFSP